MGKTAKRSDLKNLSALQYQGKTGKVGCFGQNREKHEIHPFI